MVSQSFVAGVLVDYLIPTLYLTDLLVILLLSLWLLSRPKLKLSRPLLIFLALLLPSLLTASALAPAVYKWFKLAELAGLSWWIKENINWKKHLPKISKALSVTLIFQSVLAIIQWFKQSSLFGYWFLGEQPFNATTNGMDRITWLSGALKLPPLGTTTHPNVLAGLIVVLLPLALAGTSLPIGLLVSVLALIALFLTFSLSAWLALLLIVIPFFLYRLKPVLIIGYAVVVISLIIGFWPNFEFLAPQTSFARRSQLAGMAIEMVKDSPLTGQGLNNFTVTMDKYGLVQATTRFLQPVHNIYLLIFAETGLLGLFGFGYLLICYFRSKHPAILKLSLFTLLFLGLFDHYPLTIQQGLILFFLLV